MVSQAQMDAPHPSKLTVPPSAVRKKIASIQFCAFAPEQMRKLAHLRCMNHMLYHPDTQKPIPYSVLDHRMGVSSKTGYCQTCGHSLQECVGHYGYIKLELPVFHIGYITAIKETLESVCKLCTRVLLPQEDVVRYRKMLRRPNMEALKRQEIGKKVLNQCKKTSYCPHCGSANGTIRRVASVKLVHERYRVKNNDDEAREFVESFDIALQHNSEPQSFLSKAQEDMNPLVVQNIFRRIPAADLEVLNMNPEFTRPEYFVLTHVLVPPLCIRPSIPSDTRSGSNEDDLTVCLKDIIALNNGLTSEIEAGASIERLMNQWDELQVKCAEFINSELPGFSRKGLPSKPIRSLCQRLKGKQGRFRGNLSGKRVDFSGRTVISPDPNLEISQVAVPRLVAIKLTYPERVNQHNIGRLREAVEKGPQVHPGANYIDKNGTKFDLRHGNRKDIANKLRIGDVVERHLHDGDCILFNRQPSLHRVSIMCHRAKILPFRTFRFNECVCSPYNADFDGDEMNLHVPQTEEARAEASTLLGVQQNLVTPRSGEPLVSATQDFVTGAFLMSRKNSFFDRTEMCMFCAWMGFEGTRIDLPPPAISKPMELWTGKQLFGLLVKPNDYTDVYVNFEEKTKNYSGAKDPYMCPNDGFVLFRNSELVCGTLDKKIIGDGTKNGLFYALIREYTPQYAAQCMGRISKLTTRWLMNYGFSIGISDVTPSKTLTQKKNKLVKEGYQRCDENIDLFNAGKLEQQPGCNADQTVEALLNGDLSQLRDHAGKLCLRELHWRNAPLTMAVAGSKGSPINISQMIACVTGDTEVLLGNGYDVKKIDQFTAHDHVTTVNPAHRAEDPSSQHSRFKLDVVKESKKLYRITVLSGRHIVATGDHPFLVYNPETQSSDWVLAESLSTGNFVAIRPALAPCIESRPFPSDIVLSESDFHHALAKQTQLDRSQVSVYHSQLKEMNLLPLRADHKSLPLLAKMVGQVHTDGSMIWGENESTIGVRFVVGDKREDAAELEEDLASLGVEVRATKRTSIPNNTVVHTAEIQSYLGALLLALGAPFGNKADSPTPRIPGWVRHGRKLVKREFIAAFISGGSASLHVRASPVINEGHDTLETVYWTPLIMSKQYRYMTTLKTLLVDVLDLCTEFGVHGSVESGYPPVNDQRLIAIDFHPEEKNVLNFLDSIGYRYAAAKREAAVPLHEWLRYKEHAKRTVGDLRTRVIRDYVDKNLSVSDALRGLNADAQVEAKYCTENTIRDIFRHADAYRDPNRSVHLDQGLEKYASFAETYAANGSTINLPIAKIEVAYDPKSMSDSHLPSSHRFVYDFTTVSDNHSFVANGFVTHNCVGQQTVSGSRIANGFINRTLPHFPMFSKKPAAKGFVRNSFFTGLTPTEFFFHTMAGREGLVDTAVKTAETGYMQRRLMKSLEDLSAVYDNSVRNSEGGVVQFRYGDDGLDPLNMEADDGRPVNLTRLFVHTRNTTSDASSPALAPYQFKAIVQDFLHDQDETHSPPNMKVFSRRFVEEMEEWSENWASKLLELRELLGLRGLGQQSDDDGTEDEETMGKILNASNKTTERQLKTFLQRCREKYITAQTEPGEAVGAIGAQSIGEPCTQMTLKTFHFAGVASMNITLGVPRIKEIINASKKISTPIISAELVQKRDVAAARIVKGRIEKTCLGQICKYIKEVYEPGQCYLCLKIDLEAIYALQLDINIHTVQSSVLEHKFPSKTKLKETHIKSNEKDKVFIYPPDIQREHMFHSMQQLKRELKDVIVQGIPTVTRAVISKRDNGDHELLVEGLDLLRVMAIPGVIFEKTETNHIMELETTLGIEAARTTIMNEIVYTMRNHGIGVDSRHVMLLADVMTYKGEILGITRFGVSKMKDSVLMLASFEKTTDHLFNAARLARKDAIAGVSECIIMGKPMPIGTGVFKVLKRAQKTKAAPRQPLFLGKN